MFNSRLDGFVANFQRLQTLPVSDPLLALIKKSLEPIGIVVGGILSLSAELIQLYSFESPIAHCLVNLMRGGHPLLGTLDDVDGAHHNVINRMRTSYDIDP